MSRVLLDVNVVLDVLASREPFADDAQAVLGLIETGATEGLIAAHTVTTLHFLLSQHLGKAATRRVLADLLQLVRVVAVDEATIRQAVSMNWSDFEDAVQAVCAETGKADYLVTRNKKDFRRATVRVVTPSELLALVA